MSPLLFGVVMDVVPSEARSGIPSELMYADDIVLLVMVGSCDGNIIVNSESTPVGKQCRQTLLSTQYVNSGFTSSIVVYVITCRWCMRCDGTIQEANLAKDIVMDGETYGSVIWETLLMDMVERSLLLQLESEMDGKSS